MAGAGSLLALAALWPVDGVLEGLLIGLAAVAAAAFATLWWRAHRPRFGYKD